MPDYPREGQAILYGVLFGTQFYLMVLAALVRLERPGTIALTLRYGTLAAVFGLLMLGSMQSPLIDLVAQRWLLRASFTGYGLLCLYAIGRHWYALGSQTMRRDTEDRRRASEDGQRQTEDDQRADEDARDQRKAGGGAQAAEYVKGPADG
jgi:hypothetical protein